MQITWSQSPKSRSHLNPTWRLFRSFVVGTLAGTLESDDDVDQLDNESDSDEGPEKGYRHCIYTYSPFMPVSERLLLVCSLSRERNRSLFEDDFQFFSGELEDNFQGPWNLDVAITFAKQDKESVS